MSEPVASASPDYKIELAATNRSSCKKCKKKIAKREIRFGTKIVIKEHETFVWRHVDCVTAAQKTNLSRCACEIFGFSELPEQEKLVAERVFG
jgi:hypothetical protein